MKNNFRLELQQQQLATCLSRVENMAKMKADEMDHKAEVMLDRFNKRMEVGDR